MLYFSGLYCAAPTTAAFPKSPMVSFAKYVSRYCAQTNWHNHRPSRLKLKRNDLLWAH
jgi:hypothetical protein